MVLRRRRRRRIPSSGYFKYEVDELQSQVSEMLEEFETSSEGSREEVKLNRPVNGIEEETKMTVESAGIAYCDPIA